MTVAAWHGYAARCGGPIAAEADGPATLFAPEIERYCELIRGVEQPAFGLMTKGSGESFTARARQVLRAWDMPDAGVAHLDALAESFEHTNAFLKLEWAPHGRLAAFYFRRRPAVEEVAGLLAARGVPDAVLARVLGVAGLLEKDSVHFVAAALRPGSEVHHKLYFSQYVTPERRVGVLRRLLAVADALGLEPAAVERLAELHGRLLPIGREATAFVSIACTDAAFVPGIKIDYPQVDRATCLELVPALLRDKIGADIELLCAAAGVDALSYVGVRCPAEGALGVKLYADVAPDLARVRGSLTSPAG